MDTLTKVLEFLQGKKGMIASVIGAVQAYLALKGIIGEAEIALISSLSFVLFGTASYVTKSIKQG